MVERRVNHCIAAIDKSSLVTVCQFSNDPFNLIDQMDKPASVTRLSMPTAAGVAISR